MKKATIVLCISMLVITGIAFFLLPDKIPMHFNASGEIDRYGSSFEIFLFPILALLITASSILFKKIDPKRTNYDRFIKTFWMILFIINMIMFIILITVISEALSPGTLNINMIMITMMGIVFIVLGNAMPKIKANYFIGIRTPWTIANEDVWYKTHRFAGKIWVVGGFLTFLGLLVSDEAMIFFIVGIALIQALIPTIYSYVCFKNLEK
ncbi:MAG: SdpI family protein [Longicatena sp.]